MEFLGVSYIGEEKMKKYIIGFILGFGVVYLTDRLDVLILNIMVGLAIDFLIFVMTGVNDDRPKFEYHDNPDPEDDWCF